MNVRIYLLLIAIGFNLSLLSRAHAASKAEKAGSKVPPGILLPGNPAETAKSVFQDYELVRSENDMATFTTSKGAECYRSMLVAVVKAGATVSQVNTALKKHNSRIGFMSRGGPLTLQVPVQKSESDLNGLAKKLTNTGAFQVVGMTCIPVPQ